MYHGEELALFARASQWKAYCASRIRHHIGTDVLEVGAGLGTNTRVLCKELCHSWVCLEPDPRLASRIPVTLKGSTCEQKYTLINGYLTDIAADTSFDTILYIDVLEHIEDDRQELLRASRHLKRGGTMVVLSPALRYLFSELDKAVGHYRRYTKKTLANIGPRHLKLIRLEYLDCVGVLASLTNRFLLRSQTPALKHIKFWDSIMIPLSRILDPIISFQVGKSICGVWRNDSQRPIDRIH